MSDTPKLCVDCRHFRPYYKFDVAGVGDLRMREPKELDAEGCYCGRTAASTRSLVTGEVKEERPLNRCHQERNRDGYYDPKDESRWVPLCGPEAKYFEEGPNMYYSKSDK